MGPVAQGQRKKQAYPDYADEDEDDEAYRPGMSLKELQTFRKNKKMLMKRRKNNEFFAETHKFEASGSKKPNKLIETKNEEPIFEGENSMHNEEIYTEPAESPIKRPLSHSLIYTANPKEEKTSDRALNERVQEENKNPNGFPVNKLK